MEAAAVPRWSVFTHHGHVLLFLARNPDARVRDIAQAVGVTPRTTQVILRDLRDAAYITSPIEGRRSHYAVVDDTPLRHAAETGLTVGAVAQLATRRSPASDLDRPRFVF